MLSAHKLFFVLFVSFVPSWSKSRAQKPPPSIAWPHSGFGAPQSRPARTTYQPEATMMAAPATVGASGTSPKTR